MTLIDSAQRAQATDPCSSFIVQAPAGSGKTEILTQRYLRLLSTVSAPEQIIALTFTRKAASEMRERIILALHDASVNKVATTAHQKMTLRFATEALIHSQKHQWNILQQPNRLRIITIDSLCQSINQAIPLLEQQIAYTQITEKSEQYYLSAARQCIKFALNTHEYQAAIKTLLLHVDNKQEHLLNLFKTLLAQRDQWLSILFQAKMQEKSTFEQALRFIEQHELMRFRKSLPLVLADELMRCCRELALIENNPDSPRYNLIDWYDFKQSNQETARALRHAVLGSDQNFRKSFDHHVGLKSDSCPAAQYRQLKEASKELLIQLNEYPEFLAALLQVSTLPKPEYDLEQWDVLQALFLILPLLVSHLHLLFSERNEVDFTAISQQALHALGDEENPTELALYLDYAIHHLLVDEFQDTSITQFELLTQLVQGWQPGDGKTLFIVGDPMQSIYRFRQAEVGLFFRAKLEGIGPVTLQSLELSCNFRSKQTIVEWVNQQFSHVFPAESNIESGAVSFSPSVHVKDKSSSAIYAIECIDRQQEAEYLIQQIQHELATDSEQSLAILVRSRSQLIRIIQLLRQHHIPYQGADIDLLAHLMHLRDAWSITLSLLMPGNRLAWLAALRSPYCGLQLNDIHLIAQYNKKKSIYSTLLELEQITGLSEEGIIRAQFFVTVMHEALAQRCQIRLSDWINNTLKKLYIDAILEANQLNDLEQFWGLLDRYEHQGSLLDINAFLIELESLYSQQTSASRLQIMTIHKSKGLEFDTVFLPSLGSQPSRSDKPILRWLKLPTKNGNNLLLLSPIKGAHQEHNELYDYLNKLDEEKSYYESQRLLYVAVTRAKSRLYLLDNSSKPAKKSFRGLLKHQEFHSINQEKNSEELIKTLPKLQQLPPAFYRLNATQVKLSLNNVSELTVTLPRLIGIVTHKILQWICDYHPASYEEIPWKLAENEFNKLGFNQDTKHLALTNLKKQLKQLFTDPIGQWIISQHQHEHNEYELLVERDNQLVTRIIDRTFEEANELWIIDFKTGKEDFAAHKKYQQQLNEYSMHLSYLSKLPIRCGLYYLTNSHWTHWYYESELIKDIS